MSFFGIIICGIIVGYLARLLKPGKDDMGLLMTLLIGIGGASAGSYLIDVAEVSNSPWVAVVGAIGAAIFLLYCVDLFRPRFYKKSQL